MIVCWCSAKCHALNNATFIAIIVLTESLSDVIFSEQYSNNFRTSLT